ncbi:MAG: DUF4380 domain-containing protein, partial [Oscillospiraceae bacterium]|nr:DUF4380 domain-containing protein [Oscillospiraceae bacterium]
YPDFGSSFETYTDGDFLEMETLSPMVTLGPGDSVSHSERWGLFGGVPDVVDEGGVDRHVMPLVRTFLGI